MDLYETRVIGGITFSHTPEFLAKIRSAYNIPATERVSDEDILKFFYDATKNAVDKAEKEKK